MVVDLAKAVIPVEADGAVVTLVRKVVPVGLALVKIRTLSTQVVGAGAHQPRQAPTVEGRSEGRRPRLMAAREHLSDFLISQTEGCLSAVAALSLEMVALAVVAEVLPAVAALSLGQVALAEAVAEAVAASEGQVELAEAVAAVRGLTQAQAASWVAAVGRGLTPEPRAAPLASSFAGRRGTDHEIRSHN